MSNINTNTVFFFNLAKAQAVTTRRFDSSLNGVSLNECMILYYLSMAENERMRRIDLAEKIGLTASGITRLLLPMEKIGLIKKEQNAADARVSFVTLSPGGKNKLADALERAEILAEEILESVKTKKIKEFTDLLSQLS